MSTASRLFWEVLPLLSAIIAIFYSGYRFLVTNNEMVRKDSILAVGTSILMVAAQVSWSWTLFIKQDLLGTDTANLLWTTFNVLVMLKFTYTAYWADSK